MSNNDIFVAEMEKLFGTEEALGIYFILKDTGEKLSAKEYDALYHVTTHQIPSAESYLGNGSSAICCTHYAKFIYEALPSRVKVFGFKNEENPTAFFVEKQLHPGGHDFAVVDDRYIVDPWPRHVKADPFKQMVFDLNDPSGLTEKLYGPRNCWRHMVEAEQSEVW